MSWNPSSRKCIYSAITAAVALLVATHCRTATAVVIAIDPAATYLRTNGESVAGAVPIDLAVLGISAGDTIRLERLGGWEAGAGFNFDGWTMLFGVFSASDVLLSSDQLNRVQDALDAGSDVFTGPTQFGGLATDIAEDFQISGFPDDDPLVSFVIVQVPPLASHLFVAAPDIQYSDNSDPNGDFALQIDVVPECSTLTLSSIAAICLLVWSRRSSKCAGQATRI